VTTMINLPKNLQIKPCIVHVYPIPLIYNEILECYDILSNREIYDPFYRNVYENPIYYIKKWRKWIEILVTYWQMPLDEIPSIPVDIPEPIQQQMIASNETNYMQNAFDLEMKRMNNAYENCAESASRGEIYRLPSEKIPDKDETE